MVSVFTTNKINNLNAVSATMRENTIRRGRTEDRFDLFERYVSSHVIWPIEASTTTTETRIATIREYHYAVFAARLDRSLKRYVPGDYANLEKEDVMPMRYDLYLSRARNDGRASLDDMDATLVARRDISDLPRSRWID